MKPNDVFEVAIHMTETRTVWVAFTNSDCTEGRGHDLPIAVCDIEATALRRAKHQYVQGSDGPVRPMEMIKADGKWYVPAVAVQIEQATDQDRATQRALDAKRAALAKAKAAGLSDDELLALGFRS